MLKWKMAKESIGYFVVLSQKSLEEIVSYKNALLLKTIAPGDNLKKCLNRLTKAGLSLEKLSYEQFLESLLSTKKPKIFADGQVKCDGTDWNRTEFKLLGDINITMPVEIYDNGVWVPSDRNFHMHTPPLKGELLFTPGPMLSTRKKISPDYEEVVVNGSIDQDKYNQLLDRRLTPVLYYANESAKKDGISAVITIPGLGCGVFAGKFKGKVGEFLNKALQHIIEKNAQNFTNISCVYYDPFNECGNQERNINGVKYRVRPAKQNSKSQLLGPRSYEEPGDDFSEARLYKVVAWDHVSFPGNNFFVGSRRTDDGVAAAATNSMEVITGVKGKYKAGYYLPPAGNKNWRQVVQDNEISLKAKDNVKVVTNDGAYISLAEFEKNIAKDG